MSKIINFQFELCIGQYGSCIYNLVEWDEDGKDSNEVYGDIVIAGYGDWVEGLPEIRSLSRGVYHVEGKARATEDDMEYFDIRVTPSRWLSGAEIKQPSPDNSHTPETASQG